MNDPRFVLIQLTKNLQKLEDDRDNYSDSPATALLEQIENCRQAITLTRQAIEGAINETEWQKKIKSLLSHLSLEVDESDKTSGSVTIGNVAGNIQEANIAGRDINIVQLVQQETKENRQSFDPTIPQPPNPHYSRRYALHANFTGRSIERKMLSSWLMRSQHPVLTLVAMGGMGKSALTWYWLQNDVDMSQLDGLLWWSFDEGEASFSRFLTEAIRYVSNQSIDPSSLSSTYDRVRTLVNLFQQHRILVVLDNFERELRAYASFNAAYQSEIQEIGQIDIRACIDPHVSQLLTDLTAGQTQAKILITSRLMIHDLESSDGEPLAGCRKELLEAFPPHDAVIFMRRQGVMKGTDAEIQAACEPYGYHPLSLTLLSGLIKRNKRQPGDIASAPQYHKHTSLIKAQEKILVIAYEALSKRLRHLLSRLAAFRGAMNYDAMLVLNDFAAEEQFESALDELVERGLLFFDTTEALFDIHPIVRTFTYAQLSRPIETHKKLRIYFASIPTPAPDQIHSVEDLSAIIELYHHTVKSEQFDEAWYLYDNRLRRPECVKHCETTLTRI